MPRCNTTETTATMSELICTGCRSLVTYPRSANNIRCSRCNTPNSTRSASQVVTLTCGRCGRCSRTRRVPPPWSVACAGTSTMPEARAHLLLLILGLRPFWWRIPGQ
ncbi:hypothetical protein ACQ4PT_024722 [Festuca glaucescens]